MSSRGCVTADDKFSVPLLAHAVRHLNPGNSRRSRFQTLEVELAPYVHVNTLMIGDVRKSDFGNYTCVARSSIETAREVVALQGACS